MQLYIMTSKNLGFDSKKPYAQICDIASETTLAKMQTSLLTANKTLDTLNTTLTEKHLDKNLDSIDISGQSIFVNINSCDTILPVSGTVNNNNNISAQPFLFDFAELNITMYADSCNAAVVDQLGREGWKFTNGVAGTDATSNLYWYNNSVAPYVQSNVTKGNMNCYSILNIDTVSPARCLPYVCLYSKPTGSGDAQFWYHSRWTYQVNTTDYKLYSGQSVMFVVGDQTLFKDVSPMTRRIVLELTATDGSGSDSEIMQFITLNTDCTEETEIGDQNYLIQYCGICDSTNNNVVSSKFSNSLERFSSFNNGNPDGVSCRLNNVDVSGGAINVNVVSGGGGGGGSGGLVQLQGYEGTAWADLTATTGKLNVNDASTISLDNKIYNSTEADTEAIKVYVCGSAGGGGALQAIVPSNPTSNVNVSASTYTDGSGVVHYPLESQSNLFAFNSSSGNYEGVGITTTGSLLKTQACIHTATGQDISGTVINLVRGLNVYDVGQENLGSYGNIANNITLTSVTAGSALNIANSYMNESVLVYEDTSTTLTTSILIQVSNDNTNWQTLTALYPVVGESTKRFACSKLCLKAFKYIRLYNNGVASYTNIICSLYSS